MVESFKYAVRFLSPIGLNGRAQNQTKRKGKYQRMIRDHVALVIQAHPFVRKDRERRAQDIHVI